MGAPDLAAQGLIALDVINRPVIVYLDVLGDPVRVTSAPYSIAFAPGETGDADLDGHTFDAVDASLIGLSEIANKDGGSDRMIATLSGLIGVDSDLLNQIGVRANFQGRVARVWGFMLNRGLQRVGAVWDIRTGFMSVPRIVGDSTQQTVAMEIETYTHFLSQPSNRSYLDQQEFDAGDLSAAVSIAIANGTDPNIIASASSAAAVQALRGTSTGF